MLMTSGWCGHGEVQAERISSEVRMIHDCNGRQSYNSRALYVSKYDGTIFFFCCFEGKIGCIGGVTCVAKVMSRLLFYSPVTRDIVSGNFQHNILSVAKALYI